LVRPAVRSWDVAQAARSPRCTATRATRATTTKPAATESEPDPEPAATEPYADPAAAAAATTEAAAPSAATNKSATTATTEAAAATADASTTGAAPATTASAAGQLHAAAKVFPIEEMERGQTDVGHFLFAKHEALIGRGIVGLRDTGSGHRGCGCTTHQRKTQSGGT
jgi:hypothetical protein